MKKKIIKIDGSDIEYFESGHGRPIIFLDGVGSSCEVWENIIPSFNKDYHVWAFSLPPYGTYDNKGRRYSIKSFHRLLRKLIKKFDIHKPILVGHSMGGLVSIHYAAVYPRSVEKLITISAPLSDLKDKVPLEWKVAVDFGRNSKNAQDVVDYISSHGRLVDTLSRIIFPSKEKKHKAQTIHDFLTALPVKSLCDCYYDLFTYNYTKWVEKVRVPTFMLYGTKDREIRRFRGTALYGLIPGVKIAALPSYHFIPDDMPEKLSELILDFIHGRKLSYT